MDVTLSQHTTTSKTVQEDWEQKIAAGLATLPLSIDKTPVSQLLPQGANGQASWSPLANGKKIGLDALPRYVGAGIFPGIICGKASGNLEGADIDNKGNPGADEIFQAFREQLDAEAPGLYQRLFIERSQSGGYHVIWRCTKVEGNQKLARRPATPEELIAVPTRKYVTLVETRGEGGYFAVAPMPGYTVVQGRINDYPFITEDERAAILGVFRSLNQVIEDDNPIKVSHRGHRSAWKVRPGDDFNERGDIRVFLEKHGWTHVGGERWRRPGKLTGSSATLDHVPGVFYVWSSDAHPFTENRGYSYFATYAVLEHEGDLAKAAKALHDLGYGTGLPKIKLDSSYSVAELAGKAWDALADANGDYKLLVSEDCLFERRKNVRGEFELKPVTKDRLRLLVEEESYWYRLQKGKGDELFEQAATPPDNVLTAMLSTPDPRIPVVNRVVSAPILGPDGEVLQVPGYHAACGVYYHAESRGLVVPDEPTEADFERARRLIVDDLLHDFPFADKASRAHAVALLLTPFVREMIAGNTPLYLIDAPKQGTGKSILFQAIGAVFLGHEPAAFIDPGHDDERRKRLVAIGQAKEDFVWMDNVSGTFRSDALAAAITSGWVQDRRMRYQDLIKVSLRCTWIMTANNVSFGSDWPRRSVWIRLDRGVEDPASIPASVFKHPDLLAWVREHRAELVWAALVLARYGLIHGRATGKTKASFVQWAEVIGRILDGIGLPGFLENDGALKDSADVEDEPLYSFIEAWWTAFGDKTKTADELFTSLLQGEGSVNLELGKFNSIGLANKLRSIKDRVFGDLKVIKATDGKPAKWKLTPNSEAAKDRLAEASTFRGMVG